MQTCHNKGKPEKLPFIISSLQKTIINPHQPFYIIYIQNSSHLFPQGKFKGLKIKADFRRFPSGQESCISFFAFGETSLNKSSHMYISLSQIVKYIQVALNQEPTRTEQCLPVIRNKSVQLAGLSEIWSICQHAALQVNPHRIGSLVFHSGPNGNPGAH